MFRLVVRLGNLLTNLYNKKQLSKFEREKS